MHSFHPKLFLQYSAQDIVTITVLYENQISTAWQQKILFLSFAIVSDFIEH